MNKIECPICYEEKVGIQLFNCKHAVCIDCFKRAWYGSKAKYPPFPFPLLEEEYYDNPVDDEWELYPEIRNWEIECDQADADTQVQYENEEYLRKCPYCRI
jgi:hypothetical protein